MKTIGLIGGMSWESTLEYYRIINETVNKRLGGLHSAKIVMHSFDFTEVEALMREDRWHEIAMRVGSSAKALEKAGADLLLICTNTVHTVLDGIEGYVSVPFLHIADAAGEAILRQGLKTVGLLGTRYTMEADFYRARLKSRFGLEVLTPPEATRTAIDNVIFKELCKGVRREASRDLLLRAIEGLVAQGARGIILGCTELPMLIAEGDAPVPVFDTTRLHAEAAVDRALEG